MYNRYIPQNDGSYSRQRIQNAQPPPPPPPGPQQPTVPQAPPERESSRQGNPVQSPVSFLRNLLPKEFDTGDLLILLLLLLMAGDKEEEKHSALLTAALYFFM